MPRVSVIIPSHGRRDFLEECIPSVQAQTFEDFELLVVDDDTGDGSRELVHSLGVEDARVKYVPRQGAPTGTGAAARNVGIQEGSGEYLAFLDSDDLWLPQKLERQVEVLDRRPDIGVVYCAAYLRNQAPGGGWLPDEEQPARALRHPTLYEDLIHENVVTGGCSAVVIRASCFATVGGFDELMPWAPDRDMWLRLAARFGFLRIDEPLVVLRVHASSIMERLGSSELDRWISLHQGFVRKLEQDVPAEYRRHLPAAALRRYMPVFLRCLKQRRVGPALRVLRLLIGVLATHPRLCVQVPGLLRA